ncbi:MAG: hypothetical protein JNK17_02255 [Hydrogenophaga sp.]|nr:hypothetical protein [Hydrogenophaga sp.]
MAREEEGRGVGEEGKPMMQVERVESGSLRGLKSAAELSKDRPHGDRLRYMAGCRCDACRRANSAYENARQQARKRGEWNGLVPAEKARAHVLALREKGIGRRQVADAAGVSETSLSLMLSGRRTKIRAMAERALLAVTEAAVADGAYIDAGPTWKLLDELVATGYTKAEIAIALGYSRGALQFSREQCTAANAYQVERLYARWRRVPAGPSLALIAELREEGYRPDRIERMLRELADRLHQDTPNLDTRSGFIHAGTAELLERLHLSVTGEPT